MPTSLAQIEIKISKIREYLKILQTFQDETLSELKSNLYKRGALERYLYLACDSLISLLEMYISYKQYPKASSYAENVDILQEHREINDIQSDLLHQIISFRNIISHDYEKLNLEIIQNVITKHLEDIKKILKLFEEKI